MWTCLCWCHVYKSLVEIMSHSTKKKCCLKIPMLADRENVSLSSTVRYEYNMGRIVYTFIRRYHANGFHNLTFLAFVFSTFLQLSFINKIQPTTGFSLTRLDCGYMKNIWKDAYEPQHGLPHRTYSLQFFSQHWHGDRVATMLPHTLISLSCELYLLTVETGDQEARGCADAT